MAWGRRKGVEGPGVSPGALPVDPRHPLPRVKRVEMADGTTTYVEVPSVAGPEPPGVPTPPPRRRGTLSDPDRPKQLGYPPWSDDAWAWRF